MSNRLTGTVLGYDPGGAEGERNAVAALALHEGVVTRFTRRAFATAEESFQWLNGQPLPLGAGIDTLLAWSGGRAGWRPADRALRATYPDVQGSVIAPNSLHGAMCVGGAFVAKSLRESPQFAARVLCETHPKVLYFALTGEAYDWADEQQTMVDNLLAWIDPGEADPIEQDDEFDAALSAYAVLQALRGEWTFDLLALPAEPADRLVFPVGPVTYPWPEAIA